MKPRGLWLSAGAIIDIVIKLRYNSDKEAQRSDNP